MGASQAGAGDDPGQSEYDRIRDRLARPHRLPLAPFVYVPPGALNPVFDVLALPFQAWDRQFRGMAVAGRDNAVELLQNRSYGDDPVLPANQVLPAAVLAGEPVGVLRDLQ